MRTRALLGTAWAVLAACAAVLLHPRAGGQSAVSQSRPGQEDLSFWVNHSGLLGFEAEGEVGFGDFARILLRRRSNAPLMRPLRDRFTFRTSDPAKIQTPDVFRAEWSDGRLRWLASPATVFVAGASRTFNIPLLIENKGPSDAVFEGRYTGASMTSTSGRVRVAARGSAAVFLRAVESRPGPVGGKLTLSAGSEAIDAPVRFDIRPLVRLRVRLLDERGRACAARVYLTGSDGLAWVPPGSSRRVAAIEAEYFFHAQDGFEIDMPAGETLVEAARGLEYKLVSRRITLSPGIPAEVELRLERWTDRKRDGFWSADVHIHANYTAPHHQSIEPRDVRLQAQAEDLNYANMMVANSSGSFLHDYQYFEGKPHRFSTPEHFIYWNEENRSSPYGHMCFMGLKKLVEPFYNGFPNTPWPDHYPSNFTLAQQVYDQGGAVSYAHPGMVPEFDRASIRELPVDLALGHRTAMDVLSNSDENATSEMWRRLLNCGFRVPISAGTDSFTNTVDHYTAGGGRVYVKTGPRFDYAAWLDNYRKGRSFASNGPMVWLTVNGAEPGGEVRLDAPGSVEVRGTVASQVPVNNAELLLNGRVVHEIPVRGADPVEFRKTIRIERGSWLALRALGPPHRLILNDTAAFGHTGAVYVTVAGKGAHEPDDVRFYRDWVERLIARVETRGQFSKAEQKAEVLGQFRKALDWYRAAERE